MSNAVGRASHFPPAVAEALAKLPALVTIAEASGLLRQEPSSTRYQIALGRIQSIKVGKKRLIAKDEIARLLAEGALR